MSNTSEKISKSGKCCSVPSCRTRGGKLYMFPKNPRYREEWKKVCCIKKPITNYMYVCLRHFRKSDISTTGKDRIRIKAGAKPSLFLPEPPLLESDDNVSVSLLKRYAASSQHFRESTLSSAEDFTQSLEVPMPIPKAVKVPITHSINLPMHHARNNKSSNVAVHKRGKTHMDINCRDGSEVESLYEYAIKDYVEDDSVPDGSCGKIADRFMDNVLNGLVEPESDIACPSEECVCKSKYDVPSEGRDGSMISGSQTCLTLLDLIRDDVQLQAFIGVSSSTLNNLTELILALVGKAYRSDLPIKECIVLTLCKLRLNLSFECLSALFGSDKRFCGAYFASTIHMLALVLKGVIYWPSKEEIKLSMPDCFNKFQDTCIVLDSTEMLINSPHCEKCHISLNARFSGCQKIKIMIGVTPSGLITFLSNAYPGETSNKQILEESDLIKKTMLHPYNDAVMVSKGFGIEDVCYRYHIRMHCPSLIKIKNCGNISSRAENVDFGFAKVHVDCVIQKLKAFKILEGTLSTFIVSHIDDILTVIAGLVNLSPPILLHHHFLQYKQSL